VWLEEAEEQGERGGKEDEITLKQSRRTLHVETNGMNVESVYTLIKDRQKALGRTPCC
jgi:hypothetical protein